MEKIYKRSLIALIYNVIIMAFGVFAAVVISSVIGKTIIAVGVAAVIIVWALINIYRGARTKVILNGDKLFIYDGKREFDYNMNRVQLSSEQINNDTFYLYVNTDDGENEVFDLSFLGVMKFNQLIEDLGVVGEKSEAIKLHVNK
ncbi:MAG: hypothetical protein HXM02_05535 [[Eubacterium] sulci]|nr:hypothetical protein [[Eubacterium] sulci]